jgi:hypothetical protein
MTQKIYRVQIPVDGRSQMFSITGYVAALSAAPACNGIYGVDVWYLVDDTDPKVTEVKFSVAGTGRPLSATETLIDYIDTCVMSDGLVWHVFARPVA